MDPNNEMYWKHLQKTGRNNLEDLLANAFNMLLGASLEVERLNDDKIECSFLVRPKKEYVPTFQRSRRAHNG